MAHGNADLRTQQLLQPSGGGGDGVHPVVEVIDLPAPAQLPSDGVRHNLPVVLQHIGLHRLAVGGRLFNGAHVPQARQGHVQRPGNGGGGEGEGVHLLGKLPQPLLMGHAEALLLVDDQKAEIFKLHGLLQQLVGADQNVHAPGTGGL
ncbi:hypothetical protein SDC9_95993 [bioreactor metagenome]|uniref:Uncharacterized protein n=1 Tax=bioreactor metagenome TaxID=1076179 RepID=A0A645A7V6_9ZZZZ